MALAQESNNVCYPDNDWYRGKPCITAQEWQDGYWTYYAFSRGNNFLILVDTGMESETKRKHDPISRNVRLNDQELEHKVLKHIIDRAMSGQLHLMTPAPRGWDPNAPDRVVQD